jgi:hypothetical protein
MGSYKLLLDADTQTDNIQPSAVLDQQNSQSSEIIALKQQLVEMQVDLTSQINGLDIRNDEIQEILEDLAAELADFKKLWRQKTDKENDSDILMRNVGLLS